MTARDTMEYWSQKHMAVGRGLATVTTADGRRLAGDVLVGYTAPPAPAGQPPGASRADAAGRRQAGADPLGSSGKLQRVEAFGHVEVRTATETVNGDRGVYVADTGIARIAGNVRITRGQNQLEGDEALVNMQHRHLHPDPRPRRAGAGPGRPERRQHQGRRQAAQPAQGPAPSTPARTR